MRCLLTRLLMFPLLLLASCAASQAQRAAPTENAVEGLWRYTGLTSSAGKSMPLSGIFLFKDGLFLQQAIFEGAPFEAQGAMAHSGTYTPTPAGVNLTAEYTISISPSDTPPLSFRRDTKHVLTVDRSGGGLKLVFGSGTVQTFERAGPGRGTIYKLQNGSFALVDGTFILVTADETSSVTGYGRYQRDGNVYNVQVERWAEVADGKAKNLRDVTLRVNFDGNVLSLPDGRRFTVAR